jgi:hypothetical protein
VNDAKLGGSTQTFHVRPLDSSLSNSVSALLWFGKLLYRALTTRPAAVAALKIDRFVKVCDGTSATQWSNVAYQRAISPGSGFGVSMFSATP